MTRADERSSVHRFEVIDSISTYPILRGFAAPSAGPRPCRVSLWAGDQCIAVADADNFSEEAREAGVRLGWCGFTIGGVHQAVAIDRRIELRCTVSNSVLAAWDGLEVAKHLAPVQKSRMCFSNLRHMLRDVGGCSDLHFLLPFGRDAFYSSGRSGLLNASFRLFLERDADDHAMMHTPGDFSEDISIIAFWHGITESKEFNASGEIRKLNPFKPNFPFNLSILDL